MSRNAVRGCVVSHPLRDGWLGCLVAAALLAGIAAHPAGATTRTWSGGAASAYWSGADNWGGSAPTDGDDLVFPAGAAKLVNTNNLSSKKFRSVTFTGSGGGYQIWPYASGTLIVSNGVSAQNSAGTNTVYAILRLDADQTVGVTSAGGALVLAGSVDLNGRDLTASCVGALDIKGAVTGTGDLTKTGAGTLEFSGSATNSFAGTLRVNAGTLALNKQTADTAIPGALVIGDGSGTDTVRLLRLNQIPGASTVVVASSGVLDVNSFSETLGGLIMTGGVVQTGASILAVYGEVTATSSSSGPALISGKITPGGAARTFTVGDGPASPDLRITATISGSGGGLTKEGAGELELTGTNTFTGTVTVNAGSLEVASDEALGTTAGGTVVNNDARLIVWKGAAVGAEPLTLNGDGSGTTGALYGLNGSNSWAGAITLGASTLITVRTNDYLNLAGAIGGSGKGFTKNGPGTLVLSGSSANTHTGSNTVSEGTLVLDKSASDGALVSPLVVGDGIGTDTVRFNRSNQLGASADIRVLAGGVLDLNGWSDGAGALSLEAGLVQTGAGAFTLAGALTAVSAASAQARVTGNLTLSGTRVWTVNDGPYSPDLYVSAALGGTGGFTKQGEGELQLAGAGTFSGTATVDAGHLRVTDGAALGATSGGTVVSAGAVLVLASGAAVGAEPLTLYGTGEGDLGALTGLSGSNSWAGAITLADDTVLEVHTNAYLNLAGALAGTRGFEKTGPGTLILSGSANNSHSGSNTVSQGTLALAKTGSARALGAGSLVIGHTSTESAPSRDVFVRYAGSSSSQIHSGVPITVRNTGLLDLNGRSDSLGALTLMDGLVQTGAGTLTLMGDVTTVGTDTPSSLSRLSGKLALPSDRTFSGTYTNGCALDIEAEVSGAGGMVFSFSGEVGDFDVFVRGHNTFMGDVTVNPHTWLGFSYEDSLGTSSGGVVLNGGTLVPAIGANETLTVEASSRLETSDMHAFWQGPIELNAPLDVHILVEAELSGPISGPGALRIEGGNPNSVCTLSGTDANTYAGGTSVSRITLCLNKSTVNGAIPGDLTISAKSLSDETDAVTLLANNQISDSAHVTVDGRSSDAETTYLDLNGHNDTIGGLTLIGATAQTGAGTLTVAGDVEATSTDDSAAYIYGKLALTGGGHTFTVDDGPSTPDLCVAATVSGAGGFLKNGPGELELWGNNTYSGLTTLDAGTVEVVTPDALGDTAAGTVVNSNAVLVAWHDTAVGAEPLTLNGSGNGTLGALDGRFGNNSWAGPITLGANTAISVGTNDTLTLTGMIGGAGNLTKIGPGQLALSGAMPSSFAGDTFVGDGTLVLDRSTVNTVPRSLFIGSNAENAPAAWVYYQTDSQVADNITVYRTGSLNLGNRNDAITDLTLNGGADIRTGTGELTITGNILVDPVGVTNAISQISGKLGFDGAGTRQIIVLMAPNLPGYDVVELVFSASVSGWPPLLKTGDGDLRLNISNSFSGPLTFTGGELSVMHNHALGETNGGLTIASNATLYLAVGVHVGAEPLVLDSQGSEDGRVVWTGGDCSWAGPVTLLRDTKFWSYPGCIMELSGPIGGSAGLVKSMSGELRLTGNEPNTYAGETRLEQGTMILAKAPGTTAIPGKFTIGRSSSVATSVRCDNPGMIADSALVKITAASAWLLNGQTETVGPVIGAGRIDLGLGDGFLHTSFNGLATNFAGRIEGSGTVCKEGTGTWTLSGTNTFTGLTKIFGGTLNVNGLQRASGVEVGPDSRLGGTGTVGALSGPGGTVAPGLSIGTLTASNVTFGASSSFAAELGETDCDRLVARGDVSLGGATLTLSAPGLLPAEGQTFLILDNDGANAVSGTFSGLAEGATATDGLRQYTISYAGGDGNDVVLAATNTATLRSSLAVASAPGELALSWPQNDITWELQSTTNLATAPIAWDAVPQPYPTNEAGSVVFEPGPEKQKFYRLYHP